MDKNVPLYPLKFKPILKEKIWGGTRLTDNFNKQGNGRVGESWEISGIEGDVSVVSNGYLINTSLAEIINLYKGKLVGEVVFDSFGSKFPLLFKFIDANEDLSVQLHPNDSLASKRHASFGKTEMWYIMDAEDEARLILGFKDSIEKSTYQRHLDKGTLTDLLLSEKVQKGDAFFIAPGTVHAIGGGIVLAEIQQASDITYRIYDWDRPDELGNFRELHTELALEAINFDKRSAKLSYTDNRNVPTLLKSCAYFETNKLVIDTNLDRDLASIDSFVVYMCVEGKAKLQSNNYSLNIQKGESVLIPACNTYLNFRTMGAVFLEVYIP